MVEFANIFEPDKKKPVAPLPKKEETKPAAPVSEATPAAKKAPVPEPTFPLDFSSLAGNTPDFRQTAGPVENFSGFLDEPKNPPAAAQDHQVEAQNVFNAQEVYAKALSLAQKIFTSDIKLSDNEINQIIQFVNNIIDSILQESDQELLACVFGQTPSKEADPYALNLLNVCILALELGVALDYDRKNLLKLGVAAFLHGIGMRSMRDLIHKQNKLSNKERERVEQHPLEASAMLQHIQDSLRDSTIEIIEQSHERRDGSGYPAGLKNGQISEHAQIIGLVDIYEALTHSRPYRDRYNPLEALKIIFKDKDTFDPRLTKVFLERIGIYPKGTFVEINTKEICRVLRQNPDMPSCPVIRLTYGPDGQKLGKPRDIDLSEGTRYYITRSV